MTVGLDPGRDKVGWAFVGKGRELLMSGIFPAEERALFWLALRALVGDADALALLHCKHHAYSEHRR